MPLSIDTEEEDYQYLLEEGDDSSDESESGSGDDSSNEDSEGSGSDDESGSDEDDSEDESGSDSGSDSDDDDDSDSGSASGSDSESGSGSDSDDSSKKKKKKKSKSKTENKEEKKEEEDLGGNAIFRIQQISTKLSYLLDDLHRTFKPKSVPKIDPQSVFPYPYTSLPTDSPKRLWRSKSTETIKDEIETDGSPHRHFSTHCKSPISSPIRHGDHVDRGAGGHYIYPSYAAPPSQSEIKKLYKNYSDKERRKIAENQQRERERRSRRDIAWEYETGNFSEEFITASERRRNSRKMQYENQQQESNENQLDCTMATTFDELYKHYDAERRLLEQKKNKMQRMKRKLHWFRKNNAERPLHIDEKLPLKQRNNLKNTLPLSRDGRIQIVKDREKNLLNKAAEVLLGNGTNTKPNTVDVRDDYDVVEVSPDSLQEKIMQIASEEEDTGDLMDDGQRLPTFV